MSKRLVVVMSDIEMGGGGLVDDFPYSPWLADRLLAYAEGPDGDLPIDLVFNGDTFDFLKMAVDGAHPTRITAAVALAKLRTVMQVHGRFFAALKRFNADDRAPRRVFFLLGNHDLELAFPEVQRGIAAAIGGDVQFPGIALQIGELYIEHGMQSDGMFAVDPEDLFTLHRGEPVLSLPWGAVALLDVAMPLQDRLFALDRIKPRNRVLELVPEIKDLLVTAYWNYWTTDWWRDYWGGTDPSKRISWTMIREVAYRLGTHDVDAYVGDHFKQLVRSRSDRRVAIVGHLHQPALWTWSDRRVLYTGCLRDEFAIDAVGRVERRMPKSWAEVRMEGPVVTSAQLIEETGPPAREGQVVGHVREVLENCRDLLRTPEEIAAAETHQLDQETREAAAHAAGEPLPGPRERRGPAD